MPVVKKSAFDSDIKSAILNHEGADKIFHDERIAP